MLHYAPDAPGLETLSPGGEDWAVAWQGNALPHPGLLLNLLARSRENPKRGAGTPPPLRSAYQPERLAGLCAAG